MEVWIFLAGCSYGVIVSMVFAYLMMVSVAMYIDHIDSTIINEGDDTLEFLVSVYPRIQGARILLQVGLALLWPIFGTLFAAMHAYYKDKRGFSALPRPTQSLIFLTFLGRRLPKDPQGREKSESAHA